MADTPIQPAMKPVDHDPFATSTDAPEGVSLKPVDHDPFADETTHTTARGVAGSLTRAVAPYAAGAGIGAALAAPTGIGIPLGAAAGAGAVGLTDLASMIYRPVARALGLPEMATPQTATDTALDVMGVARPSTPTERLVQATAGGAAGAVSGAGAAGEIGSTLTGAGRDIAQRLAAKPGLQAISGTTGGAAAQGAAEAGFGPAGQTVASMVGSALPGGAEAVRAPRINASQTAKNAINAGFVLPPAEASEGHIGEVNISTIAAGEAGKIKVGQYASAKNQPVVNELVKKDLGVDSNKLLVPETYKEVRDREGKTYNEVVEAVPEVDLAKDPKFVEEASKVGARSEDTERLFPSTTEPPEVTTLRDELLAHSRGDTRAVMNYIADLRFKATKNFQAQGNAMAHRTGAAQREAANVLEDAMERSVKNAPEYYTEKRDQAIARRAEATADLDYLNTSKGFMPAGEHAEKIRIAQDRVTATNGQVRYWNDRLQNAENRNEDNQTLVDRFRESRKIMAKSYDAESVTNVTTGDVSATGLGRLLQRGLTDNFRLIADSANAFRRAFQNPAAFGGVEPLSVLDIAVASLGVLKGHVAPLAAVISRPYIRSRVLSPGYQQGMISDTPRALPILPGLVNPGVMATTTPAQSAADTLGLPQ